MYVMGREITVVGTGTCVDGWEVVDRIFTN